MVTSERYPDLAAAGGLDAALTSALAEIGSRLAATGLPKDIRFLVYSRIELGNRFSQVYIAAEKRLFLLDFWRDGVHLANAHTPDIKEAAEVIDKWVATVCSLDELAELPIVSLTQVARSHDQGTEVEDRWNDYLDAIGNNFPELVAFVNAAALAPQLRQLFPFTSMNRLFFSRCTGYPYTRDTPQVHPQKDGSYNVFSHEGKLFGHGDAATAVQLVLANLPPDCGPAVRGTAETMNPT